MGRRSPIRMVCDRAEREKWRRWVRRYPEAETGRDLYRGMECRWICDDENVRAAQFRGKGLSRRATRDDVAVLHPSSAPGRGWQLSMFDELGARSHVEGKTCREAMEEAFGRPKDGGPRRLYAFEWRLEHVVTGSGKLAGARRRRR